MVLLAILLPALFYPSATPFACVMLVLIGALPPGSGAGSTATVRACRVFLGVEMVVLCVLSWWLGLLEQPLAGRAGSSRAPPGCWAARSLLRGAVPGWPRIPRAVRLVGGSAGAVGGLAGRRAGPHLVGINFLLSILVLVWVADVFAYFAGRALRPASSPAASSRPSISPGKSWEGVWGGMVGVVVLALAWVWADASATGRRWPASTPGWPSAAGGCC